MKLREVTIVVNGDTYQKIIPVEMTLAEFLRDELYLTGTKIGCNEGGCGACTVIMDDVAVNSCLVLAVHADKKHVLTIEGLAKEGDLHPLQEAFLEEGAVQCGFCTPGMLMTAKALLDRDPTPSREVIRKEIEGNICRCTGYNRIIDAIEKAAMMMRKD